MHIKYIQHFELSENRANDNHDARVNELKVPEGVQVIETEQEKLEKSTKANTTTGLPYSSLK